MMWQNTWVLGEVANTPRIKVLSDGATVCDFQVSVREKWKDSEGEERYRSSRFNVSVWGRERAHACEREIGQGNKVLVGGTVSADCWTGRDGQQRSSLKLRAMRVVRIEPDLDSDPEIPF